EFVSVVFLHAEQGELPTTKCRAGSNGDSTVVNAGCRGTISSKTTPIEIVDELEAGDIAERRALSKSSVDVEATSPSLNSASDSFDSRVVWYAMFPDIYRHHGARAYRYTMVVEDRDIGFLHKLEVQGWLSWGNRRLPRAAEKGRGGDQGTRCDWTSHMEINQMQNQKHTPSTPLTPAIPTPPIPFHPSPSCSVAIDLYFPLPSSPSPTPVSFMATTKQQQQQQQQTLKKDKEPLSSLTNGKASILLAAGGSIIYKNVDASSNSGSATSKSSDERENCPSGTSTPHSHSTTSIDSIGVTTTTTATVVKDSKKSSPPSTPNLSSMSSGKASITMPPKQPAAPVPLEAPPTIVRASSPAPQKGRNLHHTETGSSLSSGNASIVVPAKPATPVTDSPTATPNVLPSPSSASSANKRSDYFDSVSVVTPVATTAPTDITIESMAAVVAAATKLSSSPRGKLSSLNMGNASILATHSIPSPTSPKDATSPAPPKPQPKRNGSNRTSIFGNPFRRHNSDGSAPQTAPALAPVTDESGPELENHYYNAESAAAAGRAHSTDSAPALALSSTGSTAAGAARSSFFRFGRKNPVPASADEAAKKEKEKEEKEEEEAEAAAVATKEPGGSDKILVDASRADLEHRGIVVKEIKTTLKTMVIPEEHQAREAVEREGDILKRDGETFSDGADRERGRRGHFNDLSFQDEEDVTTHRHKEKLIPTDSEAVAKAQYNTLIKKAYVPGAEPRKTILVLHRIKSPTPPKCTKKKPARSTFDAVALPQDAADQKDIPTQHHVDPFRRRSYQVTKAVLAHQEEAIEKDKDSPLYQEGTTRVQYGA
ncbi:hypothetical protein BC938DRAFT_483232, partial [Jimgerdemannia flammicorona]